MKQKQAQSQNVPKWITEKGTIDEVAFCQEFRMTHDLICDHGKFYSVEGCVTDEFPLRQHIYCLIAPYVASHVQQRVDQLMATLRLDCGNMTLQDSETAIHVANGTLYPDGTFFPSKRYCRHRLKVKYDPDVTISPLWLSFLDDLLEQEDILTLQEFMGYCLLPTTIAQKMLLLVGQGGEGKSRIGVVMKAIFGDAMSNGSLSKVETNRFARADLEHLLVMVDDDLKMDALPDTNYIKTIITAETPMDLERKGQQSYQGKLNVRFMAFGNDCLQALHDRSMGFFRRQIILTTKPIRPDRETDPYLGMRLREEADGIFLWCFQGLQRLMLQDFQFTLSQKTRDNMAESIARGNNVVDFMQSEGYILFDPDFSTSSRKLYHVYRDWCEDNNLPALAPNSFLNYLIQHSHNYHLRYSKNIAIGDGRMVRGFRGIRVNNRYL